MRSCVVCKKKTEEEELNGFQECTKASCYGTFMNNLRKGDKPMFPEVKLKKKGWATKAQAKAGGKKSKKSKSGEAWRNYGNVKKENIASALNENPATVEEEQALADKV